MDSQIDLTTTARIFELFDWWYPQRLIEETGIKSGRIKYLAKQRKLYHAETSLGNINQKNQIIILENFAKSLNFYESQLFEKLLPRKIDGDRFKFVDLFAGIGGIRKPFSDIGGSCVLTCEWDTYAEKTYKANWLSSKNHQFIADIKSITQPIDVNGANIHGQEQVDHIRETVPEHHLLMAGFPCQPFSIAGVSKKNSLNRGHGFDCEDQGQLFFDICRVLSARQPPIVILENVKNLKSHSRGYTFNLIKEFLQNLDKYQQTLFASSSSKKIAGYWIANLKDEKPDPKIIDAKLFLPQHRERIILLCIREDIARRLRLNELDLSKIDIPKTTSTLEDIITPNHLVDPKYTLSPKLWNYLQEYAKKHKAKGNGFGYGMVSRNKNDVTRTLSARYYKDGAEILIDQQDLNLEPARPRRLTPQECARLMGFETDGENFNIPVSDTRAYKQFGNSVVVPVFSAVAKLLAPFIDDILDKNFY